MEHSAFRESTRILTSLLAPLEKQCLIWLAGRMPAAINSDHLTALGAAAMLGAGLAYWLARINRAALVLAVVCLMVNWFGDSLDGTLARVRGRQRPRYGFYIDHVLDALGTLFLLAGLALSGYMSPPVAMGLLITYYLFSIEVYLATYTLNTFRLSFWRIGPTELRLILAGGTLVLLFHPYATLAGRRYLLFDVGGVVAIGLLGATLVVSVLANARSLYRAEPLP